MSMLSALQKTTSGKLFKDRAAFLKELKAIDQGSEVCLFAPVPGRQRQS